MKTASPALAALINSGQFQNWRCYEFTLPGGSVIRLGTADFDILLSVASSASDYNADVNADFGGSILIPFYSGALGSGYPKIDSKSNRVTSTIKAGLDPSTWQVYILPTVQDPFTGALTFPDVVGGTPWTIACRSGFFIGAAVRIYTAYFATVPTLPLTATGRTAVGFTLDFNGIVGQVDIGETATVFTLNNFGRMMNAPFPKNIYQSSCRHLLFDAQCTLNAASYAVGGTVLAGSTASVVQATPATPGGSGNYALGQIVFSSGRNAGFRRMVTSWDRVSAFQLLYPLPYVPAVGDAFTIYPGCDKSLGGGGCAGFGNTVNFGGEPYVPLPEVQLG